MQRSDMPTPGQIPNGHQLVRELFKALNYTRVQADLQPDSQAGKDLAKFLRDVAKLCPAPATKKEIDQ